MKSDVSIKDIFLIILGIIVLILLFGKEEKVKSKIVTKFIDKPVPINDTIFLKDTLYIKNEVNDSLLKAYDDARKINDSLAREIFKKSISERRYKEVLDNDEIKIFVDSKTIGYLDNQKISYQLKKINDRGLYFGGFVGSAELNPVIGLSLSYKFKNKIVYLNAATNKSVMVGINYKIF